MIRAAAGCTPANVVSGCAICCRRSSRGVTGHRASDCSVRTRTPNYTRSDGRGSLADAAGAVALRQGHWLVLTVRGSAARRSRTSRETVEIRRGVNDVAGVCWRRSSRWRARRVDPACGSRSRDGPEAGTSRRWPGGGSRLLRPSSARTLDAPGWHDPVRSRAAGRRGCELRRGRRPRVGVALAISRAAQCATRSPGSPYRRRYIDFTISAPTRIRKETS